MADRTGLELVNMVLIVAYCLGMSLNFMVFVGRTKDTQKHSAKKTAEKTAEFFYSVDLKTGTIRPKISA